MAHEDHLGKVWTTGLERLSFFFHGFARSCQAARKRERPWLRAEDVLCGYSHKLKKLRKSEVMLVTYVADIHIYIDII